MEDDGFMLVEVPSLDVPYRLKTEPNDGFVLIDVPDKREIASAVNLPASSGSNITQEVRAIRCEFHVIPLHCDDFEKT